MRKLAQIAFPVFILICTHFCLAKNNEFPPYGFIDDMPYPLGQCFNNIINAKGDYQTYQINISFGKVSANNNQHYYTGARCAVFVFENAIIGAMESPFGTAEQTLWKIKDDGVHLYGANGTYTAAMHYALMQIAHKKVFYLHDVKGSFDDNVNMYVATVVRKQGYDTVLPDNAIVASGGADFFLAGVKRAAVGKYEFGIHSWGGQNEQGRDFPKDHPAHHQYLNFYDDLKINEAFYWFTLQMAPVNSMYYMNKLEMNKFGLINAK